MPAITMYLRPSTAQQSALQQTLANQQNPASPNYHKWLTPEQYADRFGVSPSDINKIVAWLESQGFTWTNVARGRNLDHVQRHGATSSERISRLRFIVTR